MQKGKPNFYEYANRKFGQKYSITFPIHSAANHMKGTGPLECDTCKQYGCEDGIGCNRCYSCVTGGCGPCVLDLESSIDSEKETNVINTEIDTIEDEDQKQYGCEDGIGCNRCYSCVTGGCGPCVLDLESSIDSEKETNVINTEIDTIEDEDQKTEKDKTSIDYSRSSVASSADVSNDNIAEEINQYIQENPFDEPDDVFTFAAIMKGYESGYHNNFDIATGYCS